VSLSKLIRKVTQDQREKLGYPPEQPDDATDPPVRMCAGMALSTAEASVGAHATLAKSLEGGMKVYTLKSRRFTYDLTVDPREKIIYVVTTPKH
jgi:hypothetical protein